MGNFKFNATDYHDVYHTNNDHLPDNVSFNIHDKISYTTSTANDKRYEAEVMGVKGDNLLLRVAGTSRYIKL